VNEIFISPEWDDPKEILATFAHELTPRRIVRTVTATGSRRTRFRSA
jgi:hypothetical protein